MDVSVGQSVPAFFCCNYQLRRPQVIGHSQATLQGQLHWSESDYGWIVFAFKLPMRSACACRPPDGQDWARAKAFLSPFVFWSLAAMAMLSPAPRSGSALPALR